MRTLRIAAICFTLATLVAFSPVQVLAQDDAKSATTQESPETTPADSHEGSMKDKASELTLEVGKVAKKVDDNAKARQAAAGILQPIYDLAEQMSFPAFHWVAFTLMAAGVVGYGLQLVLGKLVVLTRMGFSFTEIISDAFGLVISLVGLVLTTQAAVENSTFTQSPSSVLSATVVGAIVGLLLYRWGQAQELQATKGRSVQAAQAPRKTNP